MSDPNYDPAERHRRYIESRKLKGRSGDNQTPPKTPGEGRPPGHPTVQKPTRDTPQEAAARVGRIKAKIATLEGSLTKAMTALAEKRRSAAETEKKSSDGKTTVKERQAAQESRDKNQAKNASEAKKAAASKGGSASAKSRDAATMSVDELESRISKIKSALSSARKQLSEAQSAAGLSHSSDTSAFIRATEVYEAASTLLQHSMGAFKSRKESVHMDADFGGYVTRHDVQCADGRTILPGAFEEQDGMSVPLVWSHDRSKPDNILGHCKLEYRPDGVYGYAYFNKAPSSQSAKEAVQHGDLKFLSIFANNLKEKVRAGMAHLKDVEKGKIREVSIVLGGANPGAFIDNINFAHSDGTLEVDESEAIITMGMEIELQHAEDDAAEGDDQAIHDDEGKSIKDILETLNPEQTNAVNYLLLQALGETGEEDAQHDDDTTDDEDVVEHARPKDDQASGPDAKWLVKENVQALKLKAWFKAYGGGWLTSEAKRLVAKYHVKNIEALGSNDAAVNEFVNNALVRMNGVLDEIGVSPTGIYRLVVKKGAAKGNIYGAIEGGDANKRFALPEEPVLQHNDENATLETPEALEAAVLAFLQHSEEEATKAAEAVAVDESEEAAVPEVVVDESEEGSEEGSDEGSDDSDASEDGSVSNDDTDDATDAEEGTEGDADNGNDEAGDDVQHDDNSQEDNSMTHNVFDQAKGSATGARTTASLSHGDVKSIIESADEIGSLKKAVELFVNTNGVLVNGELQHGIENIEYLFPDAQLLENSPQFLSRRMEWVDKVLNGVRKSPIARIKTITADITPDEARARGYIKGNMKNEEFFALSKRETTPQTVYKKQKLDRDDIIDITSLDVVAWLKAEMKVMLDEEIAAAILVGDGRSNGDDDKIFETKIRPIASDAELYVTTAWVNLDDASSTVEELVEAVINNRRYYKGSGQPTFFTTETTISAFLTVKDNFGRRLYQSLAEVAAVLRVAEIVPVEIMERVSDLVGVMVNLSDYTLGADKGGQATMFDDFDIDYNKLRYLIETRLSGALTTPKAAIVFRKTAAASVLVVPVEPDFDDEASTVTVATTTGITYKNADTNATLTTGSPVELDDGEVLHVIAIAGANKHFANNANDEWTFTGVAH